MEISNLHNPITLLLAFSHFYYFELGHTPTGRLKKFDKPDINHDHERLRKDYPNIYNKLIFLFYFNFHASYVFPTNKNITTSPPPKSENKMEIHGQKKNDVAFLQKNTCK
jgi:hypothetical protein